MKFTKIILLIILVVTCKKDLEFVPTNPLDPIWTNKISASEFNVKSVDFRSNAQRIAYTLVNYNFDSVSTYKKMDNNSVLKISNIINTPKGNLKHEVIDNTYLILNKSDYIIKSFFSFNNLTDSVTKEVSYSTKFTVNELYNFTYTNDIIPDFDDSKPAFALSVISEKNFLASINDSDLSIHLFNKNFSDSTKLNFYPNSSNYNQLFIYRNNSDLIMFNAENKFDLNIEFKNSLNNKQVIKFYDIDINKYLPLNLSFDSVGYAKDSIYLHTTSNPENIDNFVLSIFDLNTYNFNNAYTPNLGKRYFVFQKTNSKTIFKIPIKNYFSNSSTIQFGVTLLTRSINNNLSIPNIKQTGHSFKYNIQTNVFEHSKLTN